MTKYNFYKLSYIFSEECNHFFSDEIDYYLFKNETDEHPYGDVLVFDQELRDGTLLVFVNEDGHTVVLNDNCEGYEDCFLAVETEEMTEIKKIMEEFRGSYLGPFQEIHRLRKLLKTP